MRRAPYQRSPGHRRANVAAILCITVFFIAFFPQGLFGGKYLLVNDSFFYSYPLRTVAWRMIRSGVLPLWTPNILSGYPLLSMAQLGLGYPLTWGYLFLPGHVAEQIYVLAPFLLLPIFTFAYLRELKRTAFASLLGALAFGYGGMMASPLANNGLVPNAVMWLPLLLIALERARHRPFVSCLLGGVAAYSMSVLTGIGQGFVYVGLVAFAYALFLVLATSTQQEPLRARLSSIRQWRPAIVVSIAGLLALGVAAFQILETARVVRRSVRESLTYEVFTQGSFPPAMLWRSFTTPIFFVIDMHTSVVPLAAALALVAVWVHLRRRELRDPRVFFWLTVAIIACVLMLGAHSPFYRIVYYLPLLNRFRVPSRHTFEWTFAIGVLAAYGWDALVPVARRWRESKLRTPWTTSHLALLLLAAAIVVGTLWWLRSQTLALGAPGWFDSVTVYNLFKLAFALLTAAALWRAALIHATRSRTIVIGATLLVLCYVEPSLLVNRWWGRIGFPASRFSKVSEATQYLQQFPPAEHRIYTRVDLMSEQFDARFDAANVSAVWNLQNLQGYEPLIFERYSKALGGAWLDAVHTLSDGKADGSLFTTRSHVLDLLNTGYVVSYPNLATSPASAGEPGIAQEMQVIGELEPHAEKTLVVQPTPADSLKLVTSLSNSTAVPEGETIALLRVYAADGKTFDRELKAGRDTAEWAHERADVRPFIPHKLAPVFDSMQVGGNKGFPAYRFQTSLPLEGHPSVIRIEIANVAQNARLGIYGAMLVDSTTKRTVALSSPYSDQWEPVYEKNQTLILHNKRALPRAWLVAEAESVRSEIALARIRGESDLPFDPRRTALLEVHQQELPALPGGGLAANSVARITDYQANHISVETNSPTATVLILSEIFYPGWEATLDGKKTEILLTDYLFRGIALPSGQHHVEMRYTAPAARNGAMISAATLLLLTGLAIYAFRSRATPSQTNDLANI